MSLISVHNYTVNYPQFSIILQNRKLTLFMYITVQYITFASCFSQKKECLHAPHNAVL